MITDLRPIFKLLILLTYLGLLGWLSVADTGKAEDIMAYGKPFLYIAQVAGVLLVFILPPGFFSLLFTKDKLRYPRLHIAPKTLPLIIGGLIFIVGLPMISWLEEINKQMILPASFSGLEQWMKDSEEKAGKLSEFLLTGTGVKNLVVNLFVIAFMAAFSEEFFFRGVLQKVFLEATKNYHVAVWVTAALFSAYHMEFYGFLPRMIMGAVLGYLFVWSGSLWVNIFAHFANNAFAVILSWLAQRGTIPEYLQDGPVQISAIAGISSFILVAALVFVVYRKWKKEQLEQVASEIPFDRN